MLGRTLLIAGGEVNLDFAASYLGKRKFDTVICADSGLDTADRLGLRVQAAMGDFDSVSREGLAKYRRQGTHFLEYPAEKDATDLHIALDWAVEREPSEILILGASGRRLDHFLANVNILMGPLARGVPASLVDRYNRLYLLDGSYNFRREEMFGKYISFLPLTERVREVTLKGFRYELEGKTLCIGDSLGVSNELAPGQEQASIAFEDGILIVIESRDS